MEGNAVITDQQTQQLRDGLEQAANALKIHEMTMRQERQDQRVQALGEQIRDARNRVVLVDASVNDMKVERRIRDTITVAEQSLETTEKALRDMNVQREQDNAAMARLASTVADMHKAYDRLHNTLLGLVIIIALFVILYVVIRRRC